MARCSPIALCLLFAAQFLLITRVQAQDEQVDTAPPPLRLVTKAERTALDDARDIKARTKLALEYMSDHLTQAEALNEKHEYDAMYTELGGFHGLLDNELLFLIKGDSSSKKVLNNLKRFEIGLRGFMPRLEVIHRELPFRYEEYVRKLIAYVRNARTRALDPLFGDTVIPNDGNDEK
jgi:hypothetical protein